MKTLEDVQRIVARCAFLDRRFRVMQKGDGFLVQVVYEEPDVNAAPGSPPVLQQARKWYVSPWATETEIVETVFAACCRSEMHRAGEHFQYQGLRVCSPHFGIAARQWMCVEGMFDARPEPEKRGE